MILGYMDEFDVLLVIATFIRFRTFIARSSQYDASTASVLDADDERASASHCERPSR